MAFEELVAEIWRRLGYSVEVSGPPIVNGIDIVARRRVPGLEQTEIAVQCKQYPPDKVAGSEYVRRLVDATTMSGLAQGALVGTGQFSEEAKQLAASRRNLSLVDLARLTEMIRQVLDREQGLITPEAAGHYVTNPDNWNRAFHQSLCRKCGSNRIKSIFVRTGLQGETNHYVDCEDCGFSELLGMEY